MTSPATPDLDSALRELKRKFGKVKRAKGKNGTEFRVKCPRCRNSKMKLYVNPLKNRFNCYTCPYKGLASNLMNIQFSYKGLFDSRSDDKKPLEEVAMPGRLIPLECLSENHPAVIYLTRVRKRPFDPEVLSKTFGVRFCDVGRVFKTEDFDYDTSNTLIFPVWMFGKLVGWQSRLMYDPDELSDEDADALGFGPGVCGGERRTPPKYWTSPGFKKGRVLFNFDIARKYDRVVITEGVFDAMAVGESAVATFGKEISDSQFQLVKNYWNEALALLDPAETDAMSNMVESISKSIKAKRMILRGYKDPGDCPTDEIWRQIVLADENDDITEDEAKRVLRVRNATRPRERGSKLWSIVG